jgi:hypothetical protein
MGPSEERGVNTSSVAQATWVQAALTRAGALVANPLFAYGTIVVLQLRVIWNVWRNKDLTYGDTASYFTMAAGWAHHLRDNVLWSPLYTNFWGTILAAVGDVYVAAMVHRVAIVLAAAVLVLAVLRAVLEPALALLLAAWWAVLPPNYDVLYEVHLFGLLPVLVAALVVRRSPSRPAIGAAFAVMAGATLLLRNELLVATAIFAAGIVIREVRVRRVDRVSLSAYARAYGVPLAIVCLLFAGAYWRSHFQGDAARAALREKHTLNVCQVYAFNYQQRHPTRFVGNPFTDCRPLMEDTFGRPMPSFLQAGRANPRAMAEYVAWNARLLPTGIQVSLFDATVTGDNPDYIPVENHRLYPLLLSLALFLLLAAGAVVLLQDREHWRRRLEPVTWMLLILGAVAITTLVVALSQRPRPEYMYGLVVGVLMLTGICASALLRRWGGHRVVSAAAVGIVIILALALSSHYPAGARPLHDAVERLEVVRELLQQPGSVLITAGDGRGMCFYLADDINAHCSAPYVATLKSRVGEGRSLADVLAEVGATAMYVEAGLGADPVFAPLLASPLLFGWRPVAEGSAADGRWSVLVPASE